MIPGAARSAGWSPLVAGEAATRARAAAEAIARDLAREEVWAALGPGLAGGLCGLALFLSYLSRALADARAGELARLLLDRAIDGLADQHAPAASLFHGFAGIAWVAEHVGPGEEEKEEEEGEQREEDEEDPNAEIDAVLLALLRQEPFQGEVDLVGGLVGWGVYALERLPRPGAAAILERVVVRLGEQAPGPSAPGAAPAAAASSPGPLDLGMALPPAPGMAGPPNVRTAGEPDLGMAHGAAGIIALLARAQAAAPSPRTAALLASAVSGVLDRRSSAEGSEEGDLAWCAGDAGLAVALLAAGRVSARRDWESAARRLATAAAGRYLSGGEGFDPALCHGAAGLSHLFHRLHRSTGDASLLAAARRWFERTLARWQPGQGIGGFRCRRRTGDGRFDWIPDPGFLTGSAGIGLSLLAAATPIEPAWDRLLLLSGRNEI
jgi:hypothetical protein